MSQSKLQSGGVLLQVVCNYLLADHTYFIVVHLVRRERWEKKEFMRVINILTNLSTYIFLKYIYLRDYFYLEIV